MRLVSFRLGSDPASTSRTGVIRDDAIAELPQRFSPMAALVEPAALAEAVSNSGGLEPTHSFDDVVHLPVVPDPTRVLCVGLNYEEHRIETRRDPTASPTIFTRYPSSLVGHGQPLVRPKESEQFDYEGELAVVIGTGGRRIPASEALGHIAGYTCFQDGSVRDWQRLTTQFTPGKNFDASGAMGPWLVTADEIPDPAALRLRTILNGDVVQDTTTDLMIFPIPELIAFCSTFTTLEPGDVIATGTPGGVGSRREPPLWLCPGDTVEVDITGVGRLVNPIVAEG